jgi:predicted nuclease of predicted toxin-antitoxin system
VPQIRFYLDEHVPRAVSKGLQQRGIDVLTTQEAGRRGRSDDEQLALALQDGRVMVTLDSDYVALAAQGTEHAGIAYAKPGTRSIGELVRGLLLIHDALQPGDMLNHVEYL